MGSTSWRNINSAGSLGEMFFRLGAVETGDGICLDGGRVNQIPIVEQLIYNFASLVDLEFTQLLDGLKVLGVKRSEAGGVQV
jgi:hypothetical protein